MNTDLILTALKAAQKGQNYALATIVESSIKGTPRKTGSKMLVLNDGTIYGSIGGGKAEKIAQEACLNALKTKKAKCLSLEFHGKEAISVCGGEIKVFIEPIITPKHLIICGAGHIGLPLSISAKMLNYKVTIIDNRKQFANKKRFPHVDKIHALNHVEALKKVKIDPNTFIMILTHEHEFDFVCLEQALKSNAGYIGVISSIKKRKLFFEKLRKKGFTSKTLKRITMPAGIDIGAQTPAEIAFSIISQLVSAENKESCGSKKFKTS
ncbi:XdhC family protein [Candidatus Omnitrophota bacterium]